MNHPHLPRALIILLFFLMVATFFVGTLRTFASAQAAAVLDDRAPTTGLLSVDKNLAAAPTSTTMIPTSGHTLTPPPTKVATSMPTPVSTPTPTAAPITEQIYVTDMTGIIALTILLVVVILVGVTLSGRTSWNKKGPR
ncbi:MAG TPA: hypothetical protein VF359_11220 [Anaerolineales bacterium]